MNGIQKKACMMTLVVLALVLSGCRKDQKRVSSSKNSKHQEQVGDVSMPLAQNESTTVSLFDEDIEAFVLEDELDNPFVQNSVTVASNMQDLDISWEEPVHLKDEIATVYFPFDSARPAADQTLALKELTKKAHEIYAKDRMVCVKGHACKYHGTDAYNVALSMRRATSIKENLVAAGIPESHLKVFGVGNEEPVSFEDTLEGQAPNRRVELYALAA